MKNNWNKLSPDYAARHYTSNNKLLNDPTYCQLAATRRDLARHRSFGSSWREAVNALHAYARLMGEKE